MERWRGGELEEGSTEVPNHKHKFLPKMRDKRVEEERWFSAYGVKSVDSGIDARLKSAEERAQEGRSLRYELRTALRKINAIPTS